MTSSTFCVHGHFYQPAREDPLTGEIPLESGASPFHDWNELIYDHCYRPNAELGNFERISFNIGPTLFEWMRIHYPQTCNQIIAQENRNMERFGVGNGMAQAYHHTILPLASRVDKITEVRWGIVDFQNRFGHAPNGMWLPETAVDLETLEVMVDCGIQFTILAPWQAKTESLDITQPYWVDLPGKKRIAVFFYQPELSTRISFDPESTMDATKFFKEILIPQFHGLLAKDGSKFLLMASDGELYGHHQKFRDKFLAHLTQLSLNTDLSQPGYPGRWLQEHQPVHSMRIISNTSWSCHHGVTRWMGHCGCTPHGEWKAHLRQAFNMLADAIDAIYLSEMQKWTDDPWELRHQYIHVLLGLKKLDDLLKAQIHQDLSDHDIRKVDMLLSAQHERQRMFTSCGWFFEDFDRIEPRNVVAYAAQAVWLTYLATGKDLIPQAMNWLRPVESWVSGLRGDVVFAERIQLTQKYFEKMLPPVWIPG